MLTKSNYLTGLQCPKLLWITKNDKERIPEIDEVQKAKFKEGELIGEFAKRLFSEGVDLSGLDFKENLDKTEELIKERKVLFEAGFLINELYSRADVLVPVGEDEWDIVEVKMGTKVKDLNLHDVAFQKYVYEKCGLKIRNCFLMHVNNEYVKSGEINPEDFFVQTDISEKVGEYSKELEENIGKMFEIIKGEEPEFSVNDLLTIEYDPFVKDDFLNSLPEENVFQLNNFRKKKAVALYKEGIVKIKDIPKDIKLSDKQKIQRDVSISGKNNFDKIKIKEFLDNLNYPIYYLDFETINPAIPKFDGMKPYQRIPFQFSLHVQEKPNGEVKHICFLAEGKDNPIPKFLLKLKDSLGDDGDILVYNQGFEKGVLRECSDAFPEYKKWYEENILPRIKDLWDVFKNFWFYDSRQKGSASIKAVLPILSNLKHDDLEIKEGATASYEWERITFLEDVSDEERERVRENLERYCELDTEAEVEIVNKLYEIIKDGE